MRHRDGVAGAGPTLQPQLYPRNQVCEGLTTVGCCVQVYQPIGQSFGIYRVDVTDFFTVPGPIIDIGKFNSHGRGKSESLCGLSRALLRSAAYVLCSRSRPSEGDDFLNLVFH